MGFQYSLATVLRVRGIVEEQEERMLQKILFEITQTLEAIARIDADLAELDASRSANLFKPSLGRNLHASYGEVAQLKQNKKDLAEKLQKLEQLRERQLMVYREARRNREMLTDMREEQLGVYESDRARREQKTLDDNFIARRGRV